MERTLSTPRILIVDDSENNRFLAKAFLKSLQCKTDEANNGLSAVELYRKQPYDLVIMDLLMPLMDGCEALEGMRELERRQNRAQAPVIIMSAFDSAADKEAILQQGADGCLDKPLNKELMIDLVSSFLCVAEHTLACSAGDAAVVSVPEDLKEIAPKYLEMLRDLAAKLERAVSNADWATARYLGHQIKGEAPSYGLELAGKLGAAVQLAAKAGDQKTAVQAAQDLQHHLQHVQLVE